MTPNQIIQTNSVWFQSFPAWKGHMFSNKLFDMDNVFLHQQVRVG